VTFSKEEVAWLKRKANETGEESWDGRYVPVSNICVKIDDVVRVCAKFDEYLRVCAKFHDILGFVLPLNRVRRFLWTYNKKLGFKLSSSGWDGTNRSNSLTRRDMRGETLCSKRVHRCVQFTVDRSPEGSREKQDRTEFGDIRATKKAQKAVRSRQM
jgi:hypothetical protein